MSLDPRPHTRTALTWAALAGLAYLTLAGALVGAVRLSYRRYR